MSSADNDGNESSEVFDPNDFPPGLLNDDCDTFPGYSLSRKIGQGGMGIVYKAHDLKLHRDVAIKRVLRDVLKGYPDARQRLLREAKSLANLNHEGLVKVYTHGDSEGLPYFVMEYVDGISLQELVERLILMMPKPSKAPRNMVERLFSYAAREGRFPDKWEAMYRGFQPGSPMAKFNAQDLFHAAAMQIIINVSNTVEYLHSQDIFHRDIKPGNIMISRDGRVLLMDLGTASMPDTSRLTKTGEILHTPGYEAPEIRAGHPANAQTDIYSLGASLYELVCLETLGQANGYGGVHCSDLIDILKRATAFHRNERYKSVLDFKSDLEYCLKVYRPYNPRFTKFVFDSFIEHAFGFFDNKKKVYQQLMLEVILSDYPKVVLGFLNQLKIENALREDLVDKLSEEISNSARNRKLRIDPVPTANRSGTALKLFNILSGDDPEAL